MLKHFTKIIIFISIILLFYISYEAFIKDSSSSWKNFDKPKAADFTSLDEEEAILDRLRQQPFDGRKFFQHTLFTKDSIFEEIQPE